MHISAAELCTLYLPNRSVTGIELLVVREHQIHKVLTVDETEVALAPCKRPSFCGKAAQGDYQSAFSCTQSVQQRRDSWTADIAIHALNLNLDYWRFEAEFVPVRNDIYSSIRSLRRDSYAIPYCLQQMGDGLCE